MTRSYCDRCGGELGERAQLHDGPRHYSPFANYPRYIIDIELCIPCFQLTVKQATQARTGVEAIRFATLPEKT